MKAWVTPLCSALIQAFVDYALPLIQGETRMRKENGLPRFAKLKKVLAK